MRQSDQCIAGSLREQLVNTTLFGCVLSVGISLLAMVVSFAITRYQSSLDELQSFGEVLAENSHTLLANSDISEASRMLSSLDKHPTLAGGWVLSADGKVLAGWNKNGYLVSLPTEYKVDAPQLIASAWREQAILLRPVNKDDESLGYIVLQADFSTKRNQLIIDLFKACFIALLALGVVYRVVVRLQSKICKPIEVVSNAAYIIANEKNYAIRVNQSACGEIGNLIDAFNHMLEVIEARNKALIEHRDELELEITTRTRELMQAKEKAEAAVEVKKNFLANMSHEIRTPMNGIIGLTELMLRDKLSPKHRDYLSRISRSASALFNITNDILDFSKIEAGRIKLCSEVFVLEELLYQCTGLFSASAKKKHVELSIIIQDSTPKLLVGDWLRMGQVFNNLVGNAVKFTENGNVSIEVIPILIESNRTSLRFIVRDTGIGVSAKQIRNLFQAFSQADNSINRRFGGTGLGLAISQQLIELMGGQISVESSPGQGSAFSFTLSFPYIDQTINSESIIENHVYTHQPSEVIHTFLGNARILLVEDDEVNQVIVQGYLGNMVGELVVAANGVEALELLLNQQNWFDLILMDMQMPDLGGIDTMHIIRQFPLFVGIPIILVTAALPQTPLAEFPEDKLCAYLYKPLKQQELFNLLAKCVQSDGEQNQLRQSSIPLPGCFDLTKLPVIVGQQGNQYAELMRFFVKKYESQGAVVMQYLQDGKYDAAASALHKLAGACAALAFKPLHDDSTALEECIRAGLEWGSHGDQFEQTHMATLTIISRLLGIRDLA